jgi:excisionase family DNA binding protein
MADELLDIPTVAARLKISRLTIYRLIHADELKAVNVAIGKQRTKLRVTESAYAEFVASHTVPATPAKERAL